MNTDRFSEYRFSGMDLSQAEIEERLDREAEKSDHQNDLAKSDSPEVCPGCGFPARHCYCHLRDIGAD